MKSNNLRIAAVQNTSPSEHILSGSTFYVPYVSFCKELRFRVGWAFRSTVAVQWQLGDCCVAPLIYGTSLSQCIPFPCGPGGGGSHQALCGARRGEQNVTQRSSCRPQPRHILHDRKHLIQYRIFCVYDGYVLSYVLC